jgi:hypothetical protein
MNNKNENNNENIKEINFSNEALNNNNNNENIKEINFSNEALNNNNENIKEINFSNNSQTENQNENENESESESNNQNDDESESESESESNNQNDDKKNISEKLNKKSNESEIKSIIFPNNNSNIENIVFNNSNEENVLQFITGNQNIEIEQEVAIKNESILYRDDIVYLKELENQLLSEYPVTKQSLKFVQKDVENVAKKLIEVKNLGIKNYEMFNKDIEYEFINDLLHDKFNSNYIIPIVLDKHKIYSKLKEDHDEQHENENDSNIYFSESLENKDGIIEENQRTQMTILKTLFHEKSLGKIDYKSYLNQESNIITSHIPQFNKNNGKNIGFLKNPLSDTLVLRYYDLKNIYWNTYKIKNDFITSKDIYDESGKIKGIEDNLFIKGDEINIVGFMILSQNNHEDLCKMHCHDNQLHKYLKKIGIITKIYNSSSSILIECNNHELTDNEIIYIDESNSFPRINNTYGKSLKIIDKNIIEIKSNVKFIQNGDYGILYSLSKLEFDYYEIVKEDNNIKFEFKESTYKNDEVNNNHNKVYLFDNIQINKTDYDTIIKTIVPNLNEIIENNINELKKSYTFDDVNSILNRNFININNLHYQQIDVIKNIFSKNLSKIINELEKDTTIVKANYKISNINKYFKDLEYFLSDKFITDKNIELVYGKYIHIGKPEDNLYLRLKWIDEQKDNGSYYYLNYLLLTYDKKSIEDEYKYINEKIKGLESLYNNLEKNLKKEYKINKKNKSNSIYQYQAYIVTEFDEEDNFKNLKKILQDNTVIFYKNDLMLWKDGKMKKFENLEPNTLALVGNDLWIWKNDYWDKTDLKSNYDNIKILCELNNLNLKDIKLDSLDCIYRKDFGCQSKMYVRLQENVNKIGAILSDFKKMIEYVDNESYLYYIKTNIEIVKKKYYSSIFDNSYKNKYNDYFKNENEIKDKSENNKKIKNNLDAVDILLNMVLALENYDDRLHYIYDIIDKDGLLIEDKIYSKKYKKVINICSHYYYFKKIDYADNPDEKIQLIDKMLSIYSDNGETAMNVHTCKVCGDFLLTTEYDDTEGFSSTGMIKRSRDTWIAEKVVESNSGENIDLIDYITSSNLEDKGFKELLLKYGLSIEDVDEAINILVFIVKNLFSKSGVTLPNTELINIIIDSMQKIKVILPYSIYRIKEIKKLQEKGFSKIDIDKIDEKNTFKIGYERFYKIKKNSIITARFLISVQTIIPSVVRSSKSTICPFNSFDDDEGITYMTCILIEMNLVLLKDKTKSEEIIKLSITEYYNDFKNLPYIKELFNKKKLYLAKESEKLGTLILSNEEKILENNLNIDVPEEVNDFILLISKAKNIENVKNLYTKLRSRLNYLAKSIKKTVNNVIGNSAISNTYSGLVELSCCTEDADKFLDYYFYISTESNNPIKNFITESNIIYNYLKYFMSVGSIHKFILYTPTKFDGIYNDIIVDNEINTPQSLIKKVFEIYVDSGIYAGTLREYIGNNEKSIDIKSGLTKEEILSKTYNIEEYQNLLRNIEKHNTKYYNNNKKIIITPSELNKLKKDSNQHLDGIINQLVKNIANILNKDKYFIEKYIDMLRNLGIFEIVLNLNVNSDKDRIKKRELLNKKRLDYLKKFYINKFKKYLSIIKNGNNKENSNINLSFIGSDTIELELQTDIYNENKKLFPFLLEDVRSYFLDINTEYDNNTINSINGIDDIYDSSYEKIKVYSEFNFNDASNVLLYIILSELNKLILCSAENQDNNSDENIVSTNIYSKNVTNNKCKYICSFILLLFEDLEADVELFMNCNEGVTKIKNSLIHDIIDYKSKMYFKEDNDYVSKMMKNSFYTKSMIVNELEENIQDTDNIESLELKDQEESEYIINKGKEYYMNKYGYLPTDDQLETYKSEYLENNHEDKIIQDEIYDLIDSTSKGKDVIDQGADYGGFNEYDFEDGDGFHYDEETYED